MKILMIPSWFPTPDKPGNGSFFREQAEALAGRGHSVAVAYADLRFALHGLPTGLFREPGFSEPRFAEQKPDGPAVGNPGAVPVFVCRRRSRVPFLEAGRALRRARMLTALYGRVEREWGRPDVLLLESCRQGPEAVELARRERLPLAYAEHFSGVLLAARAGWPRSCRLLRRQLLAALRGCDAACAVSAALKSAMESALEPARADVPASNRMGGPERADLAAVRVIPNIVDTARFTPAGEPGQAPGGRTGAFTFAAMGSLVPLKGFDVLLNALALVREKAPGVRLELAGDGPQRKTLRRLAGRLGVAGAVDFRGRVPRESAPDFFRRAQAFVFPSRAETFGLALAEALSCGLPAVAARCGGPEEIVRPQDGLLCPPGDPRALAAAMLGLMNRRGQFDAARLHAGCAARFSPGAVLPRLEALLTDAAGRHGAPPADDRHTAR